MTERSRQFWCVIPAAGKGIRFGGSTPKQYVDIAGKPLLYRTIERLAAHPQIAGLLVALARDDGHWRDRGTQFGKPVLTCIGVGERADSVLAGLRALPVSVAASDFVLVHDAARPCVRSSDISTLIERGVAAGGALLAAPLRDTLKRADPDGRVAMTEQREARWRAMTPQIFRRADLIAALELARADSIVVTDEAMAMERAGFRPLLVEGADDNIKVTTTADAELASFLLSPTADRMSGSGLRTEGS